MHFLHVIDELGLRAGDVLDEVGLSLLYLKLHAALRETLAVL